MEDLLRREPRAALSILLSILLFPGLALAEADTEEVYRFQPISAYELEIDGEQVPEAAIYHSEKAAAILVMTAELETPIALIPANKSVQRLNRDELEISDVGFVDMPAEASRTPIGTFELVNGKPVFDLQGRSLRFLDRAPLLGKQTVESILEYDRSYGVRAEQFTPQEEYMTALRQLEEDVLVEIFLSTQCQVCQDLVPHILKVAQELEGTKVRFEWYGLPLPAAGHELAQEKGITGVPSGIIYRNGQEVGRSHNYSWRFPSLAIYNTLLGVQVQLPEDRLPPSRR